MSAAADQFPRLYDELRRLAAAKLAAEPAGHTLNATALVHEAFLKLGPAEFESHGGFFRAAAAAMQRILVDHARAKRSAKRGGRGKRFVLRDGDRVRTPDLDTLPDLDSALTRLEAEDPAAAEIARLRLFAGFNLDEAAAALGVSRATAHRDWTYARAFLVEALNAE